jgi:hypothetical protein
MIDKDGYPVAATNEMIYVSSGSRWRYDDWMLNVVGAPTGHSRVKYDIYHGYKVASLECIEQAEEIRGIDPTPI